MSNTTHITDLITRMETATGPDLEIDVLIAELVGFFSPTYKGTVSDIRSWSVCNTTEIIAKSKSMDFPTYTGNLDTAITLLKNEYYWYISDASSSEKYYAEITEREGDAYTFDALAYTPALAVCISILKAYRYKLNKKGIV